MEMSCYGGNHNAKSPICTNRN